MRYMNKKKKANKEKRRSMKLFITALTVIMLLVPTLLGSAPKKGNGTLSRSGVTFAYNDVIDPLTGKVLIKGPTQEQKDALDMAYLYGKEFNLGYSCASQLWRESFLGDKISLINLDDPSFGYWHKHLKYAMIEWKKENPGKRLTESLLAQYYILDTDKAALTYLNDIEDWLKKAKGNYRLAYQYYVGGNDHYDGPDAEDYSSDVIAIGRELKREANFEERLGKQAKGRKMYK